MNGELLQALNWLCNKGLRKQREKAPPRSATPS
jgi:hypothetical protein